MWRGGEEQSIDSKGLLSNGGLEIWRYIVERYEELVKKYSFTGSSYIYLTLKEARRNSGIISRYRLMEVLRLTEARAKTLLRKLSILGLVKPLRGGHVITDLGINVFTSVSQYIDEVGIKGGDRFGYRASWTAFVHGVLSSNMVIPIRDRVIRNGGSAAIILEKRGESLVFPDTDEDLRKYDRDLYKQLITIKPSTRYTFIIIGLSPNEFTARISTVQTALDFLEGRIRY